MVLGPEEVTVLLRRIEQGEESAKEQLVGQVYDELHRIAQAMILNERSGHTLQPTALVNELYMSMFANLDAERIEDKGHLMRTAACAMRRMLIDHARKKLATKRGGGRQREDLDHVVAFYEERNIELVALDSALQEMEDWDPEMARIVELKFFGGRTNPETADAMGMSLRSMERAWVTARAWLRSRLEGEL
ncbi:MAG: RNA polymerase sigma-70 factor (ECF subfamily) [Planctomycetota bacterium]|jgi:RNA polymerase sigma-70 factor (ECF subfamily)